jgi:hypothetical protein
MELRGREPQRIGSGFLSAGGEGGQKCFAKKEAPAGERGLLKEGENNLGPFRVGGATLAAKQGRGSFGCFFVVRACATFDSYLIDALYEGGMTGL